MFPCSSERASLTIRHVPMFLLEAPLQLYLSLSSYSVIQFRKERPAVDVKTEGGVKLDQGQGEKVGTPYVG